MTRPFRRMIRRAIAIAVHDPKRTEELISDVLIVIGLLSLVAVAWASSRGFI